MLRPQFGPLNDGDSPRSTHSGVVETERFERGRQATRRPRLAKSKEIHVNQVHAPGVLHAHGKRWTTNFTRRCDAEPARKPTSPGGLTSTHGAVEQDNLASAASPTESLRRS